MTFGLRGNGNKGPFPTILKKQSPGYHGTYGVERLEKYQPGGYHPISIGDVFQERYRVVHKLCYGTYSTTWLCRDEKSDMYVAVKVGTGDSNHQEAAVLDLLNNTPPSLSKHPGRRMIPLIQDRFVLHGPNGTHPCYVTTPARCSVSGSKDGSYKRLFQADTARSLVAQLVLAVEYTHAAGVVHGDLHLGNALLRLPADFDRLSIEELYQRYGTPTTEPVVRLDNRPLQANVPPTAILPMWLGKPCEEFSASEVQLLLTDFGEAYSPSTENRRESRTPLAFAPPEARFEPERNLSFSSDIWTLACAIWLILGQRPLFEDILATQDDITAEQVDVLGKLPLEWWEKWNEKHEYFSEEGEPNQDRDVRFWDNRFEAHIQRPRRKAGITEFDREEKIAVIDMLRSMLSFKPEARLTAQDVLQCSWMVNWALPEYEKMCLVVLTEPNPNARSAVQGVYY
ncbi:kinase-like protein [Aspergillus transmontanensis]|uniref:non-specific serine/threonine protein kinase n=1 Tax=Aspergillus transmontanensis TaxID=1034304 RepID=A0A5N6VZ67_9EURO|nr:kinase-like protein [Aspergillus transmontanensis]